MKLMKMIMVCAAFMCAFLSSQSTFAQLSAGAGLVYGTDVEEIGVNLRAGYQITEAINANAGLTIFFVGDGLTFNTINLDGQYGFVNSDALSVYGLAGLNIATVKVDLGTFGSVSNTEVGLNLGGGAKFAVSDAIDIFGELKYVIGDASQLVITAGGLYNF